MRKRNETMAAKMAKLGLGVGELAEQTGLSRFTVGKALNQRGTVCAEVAGRIAEALGVSTLELGLKIHSFLAERVQA